MTVKKFKYIVLFVFLGFSVNSNLTAQNAVNDIQNINTAYLTNTRFSMDIEIKAFKKNDLMNPSEIKTGFARRNRELLHLKIDEIESIKSVSILLSVDHRNKKILISESMNQNNMLPEGMAKNLESLINACEKVDYIDVSDKTGKYILKLPSYIYTQLEFEFNKQTYMLEKLTMVLNDSQDKDEAENESEDDFIKKLVISYNNINTHPEFTNREFTTWKYIYKDGNDFKCTKEYKDYTIINQLPIK